MIRQEMICLHVCSHHCNSDEDKDIAISCQVYRLGAETLYLPIEDARSSLPVLTTELDSPCDTFVVVVTTSVQTSHVSQVQTEDWQKKGIVSAIISVQRPGSADKSGN